MLKHYWTTAIRQIKQSKMFSAINIIGFTISIAAAFFIYLWVVDEFSYDRFHKDSKEIYRVLSLSPNKKGEMQYSEFNVFGLAPVLRTEFPKIADATQFYQYGNEFMTAEYQEKKLQLKDFQVDNNFFSFFSFPVVEGDPTRLENDPNGIVLSEKTAKKLFGKEPATGKKIAETRYRETTIYTVVGVVKVPHNQLGKTENAADRLISVLYTTKEGKENLPLVSRLKPCQKVAILWFYMGCLGFLSQKFERVFSGGGEAAGGSVYENQMKIVHCLSQNDLTKKEIVRSAKLYDALYTMEFSAEQYEEMTAKTT